MIAGLEPLWNAQRELVAYWRQVYSDAKFMWNGSEAWNANMTDLKRRIDELAATGRLGMQVINGQLSPEQWKGIHKTLWASVTSQAEINGQTPSLWSDFIVPVFTDIEDYAKKGAETVSDVANKVDFLTSPIGMLLLFGILLMAVVWKVT